MTIVLAIVSGDMPGAPEMTNIGRVQKLYALFATGDFEAMRELMDPDVELHEPMGIAAAGRTTDSTRSSKTSSRG